jgi:hypothetical protein
VCGRGDGGGTCRWRARRGGASCPVTAAVEVGARERARVNGGATWLRMGWRCVVCGHDGGDGLRVGGGALCAVTERWRCVRVGGGRNVTACGVAAGRVRSRRRWRWVHVSVRV